MAEGVRLDIVLTDDAVPAGRPVPPVPSPTLKPTTAPAPSPGWMAAGASARPAPTPGGVTPVGIVAPLPVPVRVEGGPEGAAGGGAADEEVSELQQAAEYAAKWLDRFRVVVERTASVLIPLASNDVMGGFMAATDAAGKALSYIPEVGEALQTSLKAVTGAFVAVGQVTDAFIARGRQLSAFSPDIAVAGARADVRSTFADLREANELGSGIGRLTDAQSELMTMLRDTLLPMKRWVVEVLAGILETLIGWARDGYVLASDVYTYIQNLPDLIAAALTRNTDWTEAIKNHIETVAGTIRQKMDNLNRKADPFDKTLQALLDEITQRADAPLDRPDVFFGGGPGP